MGSTVVWVGMYATAGVKAFERESPVWSALMLQLYWEGGDAGFQVCFLRSFEERIGSKWRTAARPIKPATAGRPQNRCSRGRRVAAAQPRATRNAGPGRLYSAVTDGLGRGFASVTSTGPSRPKGHFNHATRLGTASNPLDQVSISSIASSAQRPPRPRERNQWALKNFQLRHFARRPQRKAVNLPLSLARH